uniref:Alpha-glucosidase n=1 Tax=Anisakis simplex TaxID=6269 RepID=A0A0M3J0X1_ANISI
LKRQLDLVWSQNGAGGFPWLTGVGWDGHIFDPSMQGRYTPQADVMQLNF